MAKGGLSLWIRKALKYLFLSDPQKFSIGALVGYGAYNFASSLSKYYSYIFLLVSVDAGQTTWCIFFILIFRWRIVYQAIKQKSPFPPEIEALFAVLADLEAHDAPQYQRNKIIDTIVKTLINQSNNDQIIKVKQQIEWEIAEQAKPEQVGH